MVTVHIFGGVGMNKYWVKKYAKIYKDMGFNNIRIYLFKDCFANNYKMKKVYIWMNKRKIKDGDIVHSISSGYIEASKSIIDKNVLFICESGTCPTFDESDNAEKDVREFLENKKLNKIIKNRIFKYMSKLNRRSSRNFKNEYNYHNKTTNKLKLSKVVFISANDEKPIMIPCRKFKDYVKFMNDDIIFNEFEGFHSKLYKNKYYTEFLNKVIFNYSK